MWICENERMLSDCTQYNTGSFVLIVLYFWMFCLFYGFIWALWRGERRVAVPATKDFCEMQFSPTDSFKLNDWIQWINFLVICLRIKWNVCCHIPSGFVFCLNWQHGFCWLEESVFAFQKSEVHVCILCIYVKMSICNWCHVRFLHLD